jgi:HlyD family secretion protein
LTRSRLVLALAFLAVAALAWWQWARREAKPEEFLTAKVDRGAVRRTVSATGTIKAVVTVQVGSQVTGVIQSLFADFNSLVKAGQVVARIDPSTFQAQLLRARADLVAARANLEGARAERVEAERVLKRTSDLATRQILSDRDLEAAEAGAATGRAREQAAAAQVEQSKAAVTVAEVNLEHTVITSPIDGVVISRSVDVGQTVAASLSAPTVFVIANDLSKMDVIASVDEADIGSVSEATAVTFTVDAFSGETFHGRIRQVRLEPVTTQNVVTYSVIIAVDNSDRKLRPGMTANVTMTVAEADGVLRVANAALRFWPDGTPREKMSEILAGAGPASPVPAAASPAGPGAAGPSGTGSPGTSGRGERRRGDFAGGPEGSRRRFRQGGEGGAGGATTPVPAPTPLAGEKAGETELRFPAPPPAEPRPRVVWVLTTAGTPEPRKALVTITDGAVSAVVGGDLKEGDSVVIGKSGGATASGTPRATNPFAPQAGPGAGGRRR